jgi:outer membrane protein assembly factor BamA
MKNFLPILFVVLTSCAQITPHYSALPINATSSQKIDALHQDAITKLSDPVFQKQMENTLTMAGKIAVSKAVSSSDKQTIKDQLYAWGYAFDSVTSMKLITVDDVNSVLITFNTKIDAEKNNDFVLAAQGVWSLIQPLLTTSKSGELVVAWAQIASRAAKAAGE